ncbi:MAG: hypothetical protein HYV62_05395, partial [Candidatus Rokubacteria bacterium]|nr:hypothetical protein [Candidatus Rokubacteria bacterium]
MRRTTVLVLAVGVIAAALSAEAQASRKVRIGWLTTGPVPFIAEFRQGLRELGYVEGQNLVIEERYAEGRPERLRELAAELVRLKVDVLVTSGTSATAAARQTTTVVPIVTVSGDPVGSGNVASLARPGGNITGLSILSTDIAVKWVELFREAFPRVARVAILRDASGTAPPVRAAETAAHALRLAPQRLEVRHEPVEIDRAFEAAVRGQAGGIVV